MLGERVIYTDGVGNVFAADVVRWFGVTAHLWVLPDGLLYDTPRLVRSVPRGDGPAAWRERDPR